MTVVCKREPLFVHGRATGQCGLHVVGAEVGGLVREKVGIGVAQQIGLWHTGQPLEAGVAQQVHTVRVLQPHQVGHALNQGVQHALLRQFGFECLFAAFDDPVKRQDRMGHVTHQLHAGVRHGLQRGPLPVFQRRKVVSLQGRRLIKIDGTGLGGLSRQVAHGRRQHCQVACEPIQHTQPQQIDQQQPAQRDPPRVVKMVLAFGSQPDERGGVVVGDVC